MLKFQTPPEHIPECPFTTSFINPNDVVGIETHVKTYSDSVTRYSPSGTPERFDCTKVLLRGGSFVLVMGAPDEVASLIENGANAPPSSEGTVQMYQNVESVFNLLR